MTSSNEFKVDWNEHRIPDNINPEHYTQGIECIDYITSKNMNFLEGNVVKYITRHKTKGVIEDIRKVIHYAELILEKKYGKDF